MEPKEIEPSEILLATLGIYPFLTGNIARLRRYHLEDAEALPARIWREANAVVRGKQYDMPKMQIDYRAMLDDLSNGITDARVTEIINAFPPELGTEAAAVSIAATRVAQELLAYIPRSEHETLSGVTALPPSDTRIWRFFAVADAIDNPMQVFALISKAALLKSQASAIQAIYPTLTVAISAALDAAITKAKAEKKSFELPTKVEYGIRVWSGQPPIEKVQLVQAQANAAAVNAAKAGAQQQMNPSKVSDRTKFDATQSQRTETGI